MSEAFLRPNEPVRFQVRHVKGRSRDGRYGRIYYMQMEIDKETHEAIEAIPDDGIVEMIAWRINSDASDKPIEESPEDKPKKEKKPAKEIGPHGKFWEAMFKRKIFDRLELKEVLDVPDSDADGTKARLKETFDVSSLTFISPAKFEDWAMQCDLHSTVSDCRLALAKLEQEG